MARPDQRVDRLAEQREGFKRGPGGLCLQDRLQVEPAALCSFIHTQKRERTIFFSKRMKQS